LRISGGHSREKIRPLILEVLRVRLVFEMFQLYSNGYGHGRSRQRPMLSGKLASHLPASCKPKRPSQIQHGIASSSRFSRKWSCLITEWCAQTVEYQ